MARPVVPASILAERGVPVELLDGSIVSLCYTFGSLMELEERFGSLTLAMEKMADEKGQQFTSLVGIMAPGLRHHSASPEYDGAPLSNPDVLAQLLDSTKLKTYADAIGEAFGKAFPKAPAAADEEDDAQDPTLSPGESGTTPPPSHSDVLMGSSGT